MVYNTFLRLKEANLHQIESEWSIVINDKMGYALAEDNIAHQLALKRTHILIFCVCS